MKIGIDIRTLEGGAQHRGIGRYATQLIENLSKIDHENEYVFVCSNDNAILPSFQLDKRFKYSYYTLNRKHIRQLRFIRILFVTRPPENLDSLQLDCILQLDISYPLNFGSIPIVSVAYDLIPLIYKETYQKVVLQKISPMHILAYVRQKAFWYFTNKQNHQYERSASIISISKHSGKDLVKYFPKVAENRIAVTPLAATKFPKPDDATKKEFSKMNLKKGLFVFYVGGLDPRKGLLKLVSDFSKAKKMMPSLKLVLGGKEFNSDIPEARELNRLIKELHMQDSVVQCSELSDKLMGQLYSNAAVAVLPSRYEGFGLGVLDAMNAGCPVICYRNSSIPEVAGSAAVMLKDGSDLTDEIVRIASNNRIRSQLVAAGHRQASKFSWEKTAQLTKAILERHSK